MPEEKTRVNSYLSIYKHDNLNIFKIQFKSLSDIELYLRKNLEINADIFYSKNSITAKEEFAGESYEKAVSYLLGGYEKGFKKFLEIKREIDNVNFRTVRGRRAVPSFVGSRPNVPGYIAGAPKTMYGLERTKQKKFIDIYLNLSYGVNTTDSQIINRGILTLNLITLLEEHDIGVNFKVFQSSYVDNEVFYAEINLKKPEEQLSVKKCYYPLCGKEFLRRILTRVLETMPVKNNWGLGYGMLLPEILNRNLFGIREDKILILSPEEMGIKGNNIYEDADNFLEKIKLKDEIRFPKYRKEEE